MTAMKPPPKKPANKPADSETDLAGSGSLALILALLQASGVTLTAQQAAALTATMSASATLGASDTQHKTDVNVPELMTSLNGLVLSNAVTHAKNIDAITLETVSTNQQYNSTMQQMQMDHRDQNHDRQININETDAYAVLSIAAAYERLRNPTPAEK
jgi:hypothetical protein